MPLTIFVLFLQLYLVTSLRIVKREAELEYWSWGLENDNGTLSSSSTPESLHAGLKSSVPITKTSTQWQGTEVNYYDKKGLLKVEHPCAPLSFNLPDFQDWNLRVSDIKCFEYIWDTRYKTDLNFLEKQCERLKWRMEHPNLIKGDPYVIGGYDAKAGKFPHMAAIGWKGDNDTWIFKCGGTLISSKFVLTAAHCTSTPSSERSGVVEPPVMVRLGAKNLVDMFNAGVRPTDVNILRIIVHPDYNPPKKYNDIALIELERDILNFTYLLAPACLYGHIDTSVLGSKATLTGWGVVDNARRTTSPELQAADVDVIDTHNCERLLRPYFNRHWNGFYNQICAGKLEGKVDACQGDSGGPLQVRIRLPRALREDFVLPSIEHMVYQTIGVIQTGIGCARKNSPGIYTRVASYIDWIERIVWTESFV